MHLWGVLSAAGESRYSPSPPACPPTICQLYVCLQEVAAANFPQWTTVAVRQPSVVPWNQKHTGHSYLEQSVPRQILLLQFKQSRQARETNTNAL